MHRMVRVFQNIENISNFVLQLFPMSYRKWVKVDKSLTFAIRGKGLEYIVSI